MKLRIDLKDPDGVWESLSNSGLDPNELPEDVAAVMDKYVEWKEYVTIELDTETGEAKVVLVNE